MKTLLNVSQTPSQTSDFLASFKVIHTEQHRAIEEAEESLPRLVVVMAGKTGQSEIVRAILYSLWNGQLVSMLGFAGLDWTVKKDLMNVMLAFGCERETFGSFYYEAVAEAIKDAGLFDWFVGES